MEAKAKVNKCDLVKLKSVARRKPLKKPKKTTYGKEENICKWHDQQCINFQNILIGFKVNLKRFPTPEAEKQITLLVQDFRWLLTVVLDRTASYHDFMCIHTHTHTHTHIHIQRNKNVTKQHYYCSVLWYFLWCWFYSTSYKRQNDDHNAQN